MSAGVELFNVVIVHSRQVIHTEHPEAINLMNQTYFITRTGRPGPCLSGCTWVSEDASDGLTL